MGRCRVEENPDEYVNYDQNTSCAKKSLEKFHFGSHPSGRHLPSPAVWLTVILPGMSSYLAHTPTDIVDSHSSQRKHRCQSTIVHARLSARLTLRTTTPGIQTGAYGLRPIVMSTASES
jgi:hypothetical protein